MYSGFGGQPDFVAGALHSRGGHAVVALRSWHDRSGASTIVPRLTDPATSFQHSVIVTEHGEAEVFGRSNTDQARLLIDRAADPRARDALREAARTPDPLDPRLLRPSPLRARLASPDVADATTGGTAAPGRLPAARPAAARRCS